jgi:hypothetical protein
MAQFSALNRLIAQADRFRWSASQSGFATPGPRGDRAKEWHHFCIFAGEIQAIVNFNISADTRPAAAPGSQLARLVTLVYAGEKHGWDGDVETFPERDVRITSEGISLEFGHNALTYRDGEFHISVALENRPVTLDIRLTPVSLPLLMRSNAPIGEGHINWLVVPRLRASGTIVSGKQVYRFEGAPAYHDHNWGAWLWGHDFAWEWGFGLPDDLANPWTLVFDRTTDRPRSTVLEMTLALWKGATLQRVFTQREVEAWPEGYLDTPQTPKYPRVMALLAPERTTEVPRRLQLRARSGEDYLEGSFEASHIAQVVIPNENDLENTIINEVGGRIKIGGVVKGEEVDLDGNAIFEFLTG